MRKAILCFLVKRDSILLLFTQYQDKAVYNGVSGYVDPGESIQQAVVREIKEEIGVMVDQQDLKYLGEYDIFNVFYTKVWQGNIIPLEVSIKRCCWFKISDLPYDKMHTGNGYWLPRFLNKIPINCEG